MTDAVIRGPVDDGSAARERTGFALFLILVALLACVRLVAQHFSLVDVDVDEAQYWDWSRELSFGYFSKPGLIAWINAGGTLVCGTGTPCIRATAILFHFAISIFVYFIADTLYGRTTAFWAGLTAALAPGVDFSARIMTTDVPLLFFWALALLAYVRLLRGGGLAWSAVLAVAFGLGLLSKYAMAYFVAGVFLAALFDRDAARLLKSPRLWLALLVGLAMLLPNVLWNIQHRFVTLHATANYVGKGFDFETPLSFLLAQFAIAGPVVFAVLLLLYARAIRRRLSPTDGMLVAFTLPPLLVVTANAFTGTANANWAATFIVSAFVVTTAVLVRERRWRAIYAGIAVGLVAQGALLIGDAFADRISLPLLRKPDVYQRVLGWHALADVVGRLADRAGAASIVIAGRNEISTLLYYRHDDPRPIYGFPPDGPPTNHFEMTRSLPATAPEPILAIVPCEENSLASDYAEVQPLGGFSVTSGPHSSRAYFAFRLSGNRGTITPGRVCG